MAASVPLWQRDLQQQLDDRDQTQCRNLAALISMYNAAAARRASLEKSLASLQAENVLLKGSADDLEKAFVAGRPASGADSKELEELRQTRATLTQRLLDTTAAESQAHQRLADLNELLRRKNDECKRRADSAIKHYDHIVSLELRLRSLQEAVRAADLATQVLRDEKRVMEIELEQRSAFLAELDKKNKLLLGAWLKHLNEEATKLNEANKIAEESAGARPRLMRPKLERTPQDDIVLPDLTDDEPASMRAGRGVAVLPSVAKKKIVAHESEINAVAASRKGNLFATASGDRTIKVFDGQGSAKAIMRGASQGMMSVQFSKNDELILGASNDNVVRIWYVETGRTRFTFTGHTDKVYAAKFTGDSTHVISGSQDRWIKVWDLEKNYCLRSIFCQSRCNDVCLLDDGGTRVATGHLDNKVRFWDMRTKECINELSDIHSGQITSLNLAPNNMELLTNSRDNTIKLVDLRMFEVLRTYSADTYRTGMNWSKSGFSNDGAYVVAGSQDGSVLVWNAHTSQLETTLRGHAGAVAGVAWSNSGTQLYSVDKDKTVIIWEAE